MTAPATSTSASSNTATATASDNDSQEENDSEAEEFVEYRLRSIVNHYGSAQVRNKLEPEYLGNNVVLCLFV